MDYSPEIGDTETESNIIREYASRIEDIFSRLEAPEGERTISFTLTHTAEERSRLANTHEMENKRQITLFRVYPQRIINLMMNESAGKQLPLDTTYSGIQIMEPLGERLHEASMRYLFNKNGDGGVVHFSKPEVNPLQVTQHNKIEDLSGGDHEYIEWILQSIEKSL